MASEGDPPAGPPPDVLLAVPDSAERVRAWRQAEAVAVALRAALVGLGLGPAQVPVLVATFDEHGRACVVCTMTPEVALILADVLAVDDAA